MPTSRARVITPEAKPARVRGIADIAMPTDGPVLSASPAPVNTKPASISHSWAAGPTAAYKSMPAAIKHKPMIIGSREPVR